MWYYANDTLHSRVIFIVQDNTLLQYLADQSFQLVIHKTYNKLKNIHTVTKRNIIPTNITINKKINY